MDIKTAMTEVRARLLALQITAPVSLGIKRVYAPIPNQSSALPDAPCWMYSVQMTGQERTASQLIQRYTAHLQLFIDDADQDRAAAIAEAFHVALVDALATHPTLSGTVTDQQLRGGTPTYPVLLERAGRAYIGCDEFLDIVLKDTRTFDAA